MAKNSQKKFLTQMDGVGPSIEGVLVLGATNTPWELDRAILSRFQKKIYIALPDGDTRQNIFRIQLKKERHNLSDTDFEELNTRTANFSARDLKACVLQALQECVSEFRTAQYWLKVTPHPIEKDLDFALEPVINATGSEPNMQKLTYDELRTQKDLVRKTILPTLCKRHFERALTLTKATCSDKDLIEFDDWTRHFGSSGS